jgi:hypothetical protein
VIDERNEKIKKNRRRRHSYTETYEKVITEREASSNIVHECC